MNYFPVQMVKEIAIKCYLLCFKLVYNLFKICPQKDKITFVVSFEENTSFLYHEIARRKLPFQVVILHKSAFSQEFQQELQNTTVIPFETANLFSWLRSIYHIATAKHLIIDNYFAFLAAIQLRKNVECIQIWHAAGALKTFGLEDHSIVYRSKAAKQRFRRVYAQFNRIVVGSEKMAGIFVESFAVPAENMLRIGVPRTDFFFDKTKHETIKKEFAHNYPRLKGKRILLYAPTFRDSQLADFQISLDIDKLYQTLKDDYLLLIKLHPAVQSSHNYQERYPDFVYDFSGFKRMNELLIIADLLITDYSSIPFEFALLNKPMIFFPYDLEFYKRERGVIADYEAVVPGPIAFDTEGVIELIRTIDADDGQARTAAFSQIWNEYSNGDAAKKLVDYIASASKKF
ncbi:CDP-glycerol glycerophosphotransferase family protein [Neobacillus sp. NPDC058068]|uniref:CDP-glycerol glycerophosphotransferase family protein n=1 Tax=Neobacillus sp. NPDC058068 TaxID=3346325 RepID=UPI0036D95E49